VMASKLREAVWRPNCGDWWIARLGANSRSARRWNYECVGIGQGHWNTRSAETWKFTPDEANSQWRPIARSGVAAGEMHCASARDTEQATAGRVWRRLSCEWANCAGGANWQRRWNAKGASAR